MGLRLLEESEIIGCDLIEHGVSHVISGVPIVQAAQKLEDITTNGTNGNANNTKEFQDRLKILFATFADACIQ